MRIVQTENRPFHVLECLFCRKLCLVVFVFVLHELGAVTLSKKKNAPGNKVGAVRLLNLARCTKPLRKRSVGCTPTTKYGIIQGSRQLHQGHCSLLTSLRVPSPAGSTLSAAYFFFFRRSIRLKIPSISISRSRYRLLTCKNHRTSCLTALLTSRCSLSAR